MGNTVSYGFGWGLILNTKQQKQLKKYLINYISQLDEAHPFNDSVWYTLDLNELELYDAIEDLYDNQISVHGTDKDGEFYLILLANNSVLNDYGQGFVNLKTKNKNPLESFADNLVPLKAEENIITLFATHINQSPTWHVFCSYD